MLVPPDCLHDIDTHAAFHGEAPARETMPGTTLRIELLGHVRITDGDGGEVALPSARRQALLAHLILHREAPVRRERLAFLFWPDSQDAQARTNLRRELHHLRAELPQAEALLTVGPDALRWVSAPQVSVDVDELEQAIETAAAARERSEVGAELRALERAAALYRGELLPSCYEDWIEPLRQRLRNALLAGLVRLVELQEARGAHAAAVAHAERALAIEPLDEAGYRALMRLHQRAGNRAAAIHAFHRCAGVLRRELDVAPGPATRKAYEALLAAEHRPDGASSGSEDTRDSVPLVGRAATLETLEETWRRSRAPHPEMVVVYGEAGIGKTRLIEEFVRSKQAHAATIASARAYAAEGPFSYGLALDWLRSETVAAGIPELPAAWRSEIARLAPELSPAAEVGPPPDTVPSAWQRRRLLEAIGHAVLAAPEPRLLIADDLQWADADSLDALHLLTRLQPDAQLLVVATVRTEELPGNAPLEELLLALRYGGHLVELELGRLSERETALLACEVADATLTDDQLQRVHRISEGVPLFIVEALRAHAGWRAEWLAQEDGVAPTTVPPRVRAVLTARLTQLSPAARSLAGLAATLGRAFRFEVLRRASDLSEEDLVRSLDELWRRRIVREQVAGAYDFSHDALRDAAYVGMDPARRRLLHRRVARALEGVEPAAVDAMSGRLAHHYEQGGEPWRAIEAYRRAAGAAARVFSHAEAVRLLGRALALLETLPASEERDRWELELQLAKVIPVRSLGGYTAPALDAAMHRARALSERLGDLGRLYQALRNQQTARFVSGQLHEALELSQRLQALARDVPDREAEGDHAMAGTLLTMGELEGAIRHFERSERGYDSELGAEQRSVFGADLGVFTTAWQAHALWLYGLADRAAVASRRAVRLADALRHPYSQALAHAYASALHYMRRDRKACLEHATATTALCQRYGFAYYVHWGRIFGAWADPRFDAEARIDRVRSSIAGLEREGAAVRRPFYQSVLAVALAAGGRSDEARATLAGAAHLAETNEERWWAPEIARLDAMLRREPGARLDCLHSALGRAQAMKARPLAARAAVSLALTLRSRGRIEEARSALRRVLDGCPPRGHDADQTRAGRLLAHLER